jgi:ketosteroid isomerase-like protein
MKHLFHHRSLIEAGGNLKIIVLLLGLMPSSGMMAADPDSASSLFSLREAERSFSKMAAAQGQKAAFVEFLSEDAVIFREDVIPNAKHWWQGRAPRPFLLKWEPEFMDIAASGDFGISLGPWELQEYRPYTPVRATGYFLSVWKKQTDGTWRVILDAGILTPKMDHYEFNFSFPANADKPQSFKVDAGQSSGKDELMRSDEALASAWRTKPVAETLTAYFAPDIRLLRNDHQPTNDMDSIKAVIRNGSATYDWKPMYGSVADSGDLGYTYGAYAFKDKEGKSNKGFYVRIWKRQPSKEWKIVVDLF